jgi:threonine synthase
MEFVSTRGGGGRVSFQEAVSMGLAPDGGLFVPEKLPDLSEEIASWEGLPYSELCFRFFSLFATDTDPEELRETVDHASSSFDDPEIAPVRKLGEGLSVLELFHGPTLAFKDFALQWLGGLYGKQIERSGRSIAVLGATSGDTGAAAIHGLLGKEGVSIFIL